MLNKAVFVVLEQTEQNRGKAADILKRAAARLENTKNAGEPGNGFHALEVQYNPSSLVCSLAAPPVSCADLQDGQVRRGFTQSMSNAEQNLSFDLMIDDSGKQNVRQVVQGFLAMLLEESTREVIFCWGGMSFRGQVSEITASYRMFDSAGTPIRGKLHITICQSDKGGVLKNEL